MLKQLLYSLISLYEEFTQKKPQDTTSVQHSLPTVMSKEKLATMSHVLASKVSGQSEAIAAISRALLIHEMGLKEANKPIGSFLCLGPTGVGKTHLAKALAWFLFGDESKLIRIDMSEYMEQHAIGRLIGAPPGYIGYDEGGQLTEKVRATPYAVVLFDEIEKAHFKVFDVFLQMLDEGHLTDGKGRTVSFRNCVIIMTSNLGAEYIVQEYTNATSSTSTLKSTIQAMLKSKFRPEFLNRIDDTLIFNPLSYTTIEAIAYTELQELQERLSKRNLILTFEPAIVTHVAQLGYNREFGARPLKRIIQHHITQQIASHLLHSPLSSSFTLTIAHDNTITLIAQ